MSSFYNSTSFPDSVLNLRVGKKSASIYFDDRVWKRAKTVKITLLRGFSLEAVGEALSILYFNRCRQRATFTRDEVPDPDYWANKRWFRFNIVRPEEDDTGDA